MEAETGKSKRAKAECDGVEHDCWSFFELIIVQRGFNALVARTMT